jgi:Beta-propeller repeat
MFAVVLWVALAPAPETPFPGRLPLSPEEPASAPEPAWLAPLSAPLPLTGGSARPTSPSQAAREEELRDAYARLPLSFVENAGQLDRPVRYYAQGQGFGFYFTRKEALLSFQRSKRRGAALALGFRGASPAATLSAHAGLPGKVNYLLGDEPANWHRNLATYAELRYRELWPGIDMVVRGQGGKLKYEFHLRPGADPNDIHLAYRGAQGLSLDAAGSLLIDTPLGALRDTPPLSYQRIAGKRVPVESRYVLEGKSGYGFALGGYDSARSLVIDPGLAYSTYLGGGGDDEGFGMALDASGSAYVTGTTQSGDFPTTTGVDDNVLGGTEDAFVTKLNASGSNLVYSTYLGGGSNELSFGIAVDASGNAHLTGQTSSVDFPTTTGADDTTLGGSNDAFVTKLNASGSDLTYSTYLGGGGFEEGAGIAVDPGGSAYVAGGTDSGDFPTTSGAYDTAHNGATDAFVTKVNASGSDLVYSTYLGGAARDAYFGIDSGGIAVDTGGNAYVTGRTDSGDFPTSTGAHDSTLGGPGDAFVTKLNPAGSDLAYSTHIGGGAAEWGVGVALDPAGSAHVTGLTFSTDFPATTGADDTTLGGSGDAFVTKLDPTGTALSYATYLGGGGFDQGTGVAVEAGGSAYVTGLTFSTDFPATPDADDTSLGGFEDAFVTKLNPAGSDLTYSTYLGGDEDLELALGIAVDAGGSAYVAGQTSSSDFPTSTGAHDTTLGGSGDTFITKLDLGPLPQCADGDDNDSDSLTDFPTDRGCSSPADDDETGFLFGKGRIGAQFSAMSINVKRASRYLLWYQPAHIAKLRAFLDGTGSASGEQVVRGVIYSLSGSLLAETEEVTIGAGQEPGWVDLPLPERLTLNRGYYRLGLHTGATHGIARYAWDPVANSRRFNIDNYANGAADPFGSASSDNQQISIHAAGDRDYPGPTG